MRNRFSDAEWEQLLRLPLLLFQFVGIIDGDIQDEEFDELADGIQRGISLKDPLHRDLYVDLANPQRFEDIAAASAAFIRKSFDETLVEFDSARRILHTEAVTLPEPPPVDAQGLPMRIVY